MREIAKEAGLSLAAKPDSQEICFVPGGDYKRFLEAYLEEQGETVPDSSGDLVTASGEVIGQHEGIHHFTVGQRKGLGVSSPTPLYVLQIDPGVSQRCCWAGDRPCDRDDARTPVELDFDSRAYRRNACAREDSAPL